MKQPSPNQAKDPQFGADFHPIMRTFLLSIFILLVILTLAISFRSLAAIVIGIFAGLAITFVALLKSYISIVLKSMRILFFLVIYFSIILMGMMILRPPGFPGLPGCIASDYRATITPANDSLTIFRTSEQLTLAKNRIIIELELIEILGTSNISEEELASQLSGYFQVPSTWRILPDHFLSYQLPTRYISIKPLGLFVFEVVVDTPYDELKQTLSPAGRDEFSPCITGSRNVFVKSLPNKSFLSAKNAFDVNISTYLDIESIKWQTADTNISFAIVKPPLHNLRPVIDTIIQITYTKSWLITLLGFIIASLIGTLGGSWFWRKATSLIQLIRRGRYTNNEQTHTTIIVSHTGEEKDIKVNKDKTDL